MRFCRAGPGKDELLEEFKGPLIVNAEAKANDLYRCCREVESPGEDEHINTVVVVAAAATAVVQICLRFICMQALFLEIIIVHFLRQRQLC